MSLSNKRIEGTSGAIAETVAALFVDVTMEYDQRADFFLQK